MSIPRQSKDIGDPLYAVYSGTKAYVNFFSKSLACEVEKYNITVEVWTFSQASCSSAMFLTLFPPSSPRSVMLPSSVLARRLTLKLPSTRSVCGLEESVIGSRQGFCDCCSLLDSCSSELGVRDHSSSSFEIRMFQEVSLNG